MLKSAVALSASIILALCKRFYKHFFPNNEIVNFEFVVINTFINIIVFSKKNRLAIIYIYEKS